MNSISEPATLLKMNCFLGISQIFCLKISGDFFHQTLPCAFVVNIKYVVLGLFKIIQNYGNKKINN